MIEFLDSELMTHIWKSMFYKISLVK
jgi:hypothetical protein